MFMTRRLLAPLCLTALALAVVMVRAEPPKVDPKKDDSKEKIDDAAKRKVLTDFLHWMLTDGQSMAAPLNYAPLPPQVVEMGKKALDRITVGG